MIGTLVDRVAESAALDGMLAAIRDGLSGVLVLRGEAGIGKTALLEYATEQAGDMQVARVAGAESEMDLGFAGLHQLLVPFLPGVDRLPAPQRQALEAAFGLASSPAPDRFMVGLATLTLLSEVAASVPLLVIVDNAQWLDRASVEVLAFVSRRLLADPVGMLFAVRTEDEGRATLEGLPELVVTGLPEEAAEELLAAVTGVPVDPRVVTLLVAETAGNPLALQEFAGELTVEQLTGAAPLPGPLRFGGRLKELYLARVRALPDDTRLLVLLAAADQLGDQGKIWRAARHLGIDPDAADISAAGRLLSWEPRPRFRHPLMRSAAYYAASGVVRRRAHEALAVVTDPVAQPDRRAWHLAAAAVGPDEEVAAGLEESADRARARGGWVSSAVFLERAAELTPDPGRRAHRLLAAAEARLAAGDVPAAEMLAGTAGPDLAGPLARAKARRIEGLTLYAAGRMPEATTALLEAAALLQPLDLRLARDTLLNAFAAAQLSGDAGAGTAQVLAMVQAAADGEKDAVGLLLDGYAALAERRYADGAALLRQAIAPLAGDQPIPDETLPYFLAITTAAGLLHDDAARHELERRWVAELRDRGALAALLVALTSQLTVQIEEGRFTDSDATLAEGWVLSEATGYRAYLGSFVWVKLWGLAWQGREADVRPLAAGLLGEFTERGEGNAARGVHRALAVLELGLGNYADALRHARENQLYQDVLEFGAVTEVVEAAVRSGERQTAADALAALEPWALATGTHWALGLLARCRALLADDGHAEADYQLAIEHLRQTRIAPELARAHLVYGEWLRRRRRRRDAREQLRAAFQLFERLGMVAFASRARAELRATGEHATRRAPGSADEVLTPQETQIARLAGEGATNAEIAARLFISAATVEYHLHKVFRKLGITTRVQLARLATPDP